MTPQQRGNLIKWREALSSGKYIQAKQVLRTSCNGFCCLGVLIDIFAPEDWRHVNSLQRYMHCYGDHSGTIIKERLFEDLTSLGEKEMCEFIDINDGSYNFDGVIKYIDDLLDNQYNEGCQNGN